MRPPSTTVFLCALLGGASAAPQLRESNICIPQRDSDPRGRAAGVRERNSGFIYGPSLIGEAAPFPNGTLGNARAKADYALWSVDRKEIDGRIAADLKQIQASVQAVSHVQPSARKHHQMANTNSEWWSEDLG